MEHTLAQIARITGGQLHGTPDTTVNHIFIDSRSLYTSPSSLFVAIKGRRNDGHQFVSEVLRRGVNCFLLQKLPATGQPPALQCVVVDDTLRALQQLAAWHRQQFDVPVIGITGSNGKTIVKEWAFQLMHRRLKIVRSPKSYNSQVGVPLSAFLLRKTHCEMAIFEAGISQPGEMQRLTPIINPSIGIITTIGDAHQENFDSYNHKTEEKLRLFENAKVLLYCKDKKLINNAIINNKKLGDVKKLTWSVEDATVDLFLYKTERKAEKTRLFARYRQQEMDITIPFTDTASVENVMHLWLLMLHLNFGAGYIRQRMAQLVSVAMRLEMRKGINNCTIINDSYNSDLNSLSIALDYLHQQRQHQHKVLIISDILQSNLQENELYAELAHILQHYSISQMIGIGPKMNKNSHIFAENSRFYQSTDEFLQQHRSNYFHDTTILLKGARSFQFERISQLLQEQTHRTVLEINLNAIVHNLNYFRSLLPKTTKMMAMVKAFSYGSGSFEIANVLQHQRLDYLAVAFIDEGVELRKAGVTLPILVLNPEMAHFDTLLEYQLEAEIFNFEGLEQLHQTAKKHSIISVPLHLKIDTGMHRLGFEASQIDKLISKLSYYDSFRVRSVFSHLAASDEPEQNEFTQRQIELFRQLSAKIIAELNYPVLRHILNSAGIERFPQAHFDMVRLGIGLYGVSAVEQNKLQHISTLKTHISQIKTLQNGDTVGYSRRGKIQQPRQQIATIAIGYADGFNRKLSNGKGKVLVNGQFARIVGNICMDMSMIDVTGIGANTGDEVIIFNEDYTVSDIARLLGTIPYEVMTSISHRVKKIYFQE